MKPYDVKTVDHTPIIDYIEGVRKERIAQLNNRYPDYAVNNRNRYYNEPNNVIPFFDIICESLLHKDGNGYLEVTNFTYQMNCFAKSIFHRKMWIEMVDKKEPFLYFIWDDWKTNQIDNEFDILEEQALKEFENAKDLLEFHQRFLYNDDYKFVNDNEMRELFDELVRTGLFLGKTGDLYQVYQNVDMETADTNTKYLYHSNSLTKLNRIHLEANFKVRTMPALASIKSKFNFIPKNDPYELFDGIWSQVKFGNTVWFLPQFLLFYGTK